MDTSESYISRLNRVHYFKNPVIHIFQQIKITFTVSIRPNTVGNIRNGSSGNEGK